MIEQKDSIDICDFIDSKAIREHLKKIGYKFSADEAAYVVWQSVKHSMSEKHSAWNQIIDTMEDVDLSKFVNQAYNGDCAINTEEYYSLHYFLERYMETENKLVEIGTSNENKAVFSFKIYYEGDTNTCEDRRLFSNFEDLCDALEWEGNIFHPLNCVYIKKQWINSETRCPKLIELKFSPDMELYDLYNYSYVLTDMEEGIMNVFEEMWFDIPTPFQKGDILYEDKTGVVGRKCWESPFVLECIFYRNQNENGAKKGKNDHIFDMNACGYFLNEEIQNLCCRCIHRYLQLDYYDKELKGAEKMLKVMSNFFKGNIPVSLLINAYGILINEGQNKQIYDDLGFIDEDWEYAGLK